MKRAPSRPCALLLVIALPALALSGCLGGGSESTSASAHFRPSASAVTTSAAVVSTASVAPDPFAILRGQGALVVATTEPSRLVTATAVARAEARSVIDSATVVTAAKARLTDGGVARDRLVWVVGLAPVAVHQHGQSTHAEAPGREAVVLDAETGAWLESAETSMRGATR